MASPYPPCNIYQADCVAALKQLPAGQVDLAFADPPFNIGFDYDVYDDGQDPETYLGWCKQWIGEVHRVLKDDGTFWLAIGDEYAAELKVIAQREIGFRCRSWVIWYYTFGVNCKSKFTRSHAHLFYFVKNEKQFTFRGDDLENRIPSARQLVYADKRANPNGRLPDDTWIIEPTEEAQGSLSLGVPTASTWVLRPQDLADRFTPQEDTWYFPRVAGTFKEREGFHGCQMPEQLLGRIIRTCSNPDDLVLDPFSGSATTLVAAKKLGRNYLGFDLSPQYIQRGQERLASIRPGDPLDGSAEPTMSAPATSKGKRRRDAPLTVPTPAFMIPQQNQSMSQGEIDKAVISAFERNANGFSVDRVIADITLNSPFIETCNKLGIPCTAKEINLRLFALRKSKKLPESAKATRFTSINPVQMDRYLDACEVAMSRMKELFHISLDTIFCCPIAGMEFDKLAGQIAPGFTSLEYRWAAMSLRKMTKQLASKAPQIRVPRLGRMTEFNENIESKIPHEDGVYVLYDSKQKPLYAGETFNLFDRLVRQIRRSDPHAGLWQFSEEMLVKWCSLPSSGNVFSQSSLFTHQPGLVVRLNPQLNLRYDSSSL